MAFFIEKKAFWHKNKIKTPDFFGLRCFSDFQKFIL